MRTHFDASRVPRIGQGTWEMEHDHDPIRAIRAGIDAGLTHIDTAEMYGSGRVEALVGKAIDGRRDDVYLVSKVLPYNASREGTLAACERSLSALNTDRLDCYLLHWPGSEPLEQTLEAFQTLLDAGKIASFGVSNFDVPELEAFSEIAGVDNVACNQVLYHPGERAAENRVIPWCRERGIPVVAYSPFGHGKLPGPGSVVGDALLKVARAMAVSPYQVALQFVTRQAGLFTIPKASQVEHVVDNAASLNWALTPEHQAFLESALPTSRSRGLPML